MRDGEPRAASRKDTRMGKLDGPRAIRLSSKGEPTLIVSTTGTYTWITSDKGSGADQDVTLWRPDPENGYFIIGDYAQANYQPATGISLIVKAINDDPASPLLKEPRTWSVVYTDVGSGGDYDWSIWSAVPYDGYVPIGMVAVMGYSAPTIQNYRCVRRDLAVGSSATVKIWSDKGSGGDADVTAWAIQDVPNAFVAQANYDSFSGSVFRLKSAD
jgi:hypothetical protein